MTDYAMTEEQAERLGWLRGAEIIELMLLVGREAETSAWVRTDLTVEQIRRRLLDDRFAAAPSAGRPGAQPAPMSAIESAFAQRGMRLVR